MPVKLVVDTDQLHTGARQVATAAARAGVAIDQARWAASGVAAAVPGSLTDEAWVQALRHTTAALAAEVELLSSFGGGVSDAARTYERSEASLRPPTRWAE